MTEPSADDPRAPFLRAVAQAERVVAEVDPSQLSGPTPCADYDVRTLLGHLVTVLRRVDTVGAGGLPTDVPQVTTDVPDADWLATFRAARAAMTRTWSDDAVLDRVLTLPFGRLPGRQAIGGGYLVEMTTHGWDLASATGTRHLLDAELAEAALGVAGTLLPAEPRGGQVPFGPVVEVPADADPYTRLAGWLGRRG